MSKFIRGHVVDAPHKVLKRGNTSLSKVVVGGCTQKSSSWGECCYEVTFRGMGRSNALDPSCENYIGCYC